MTVLTGDDPQRATARHSKRQSKRQSINNRLSVLSRISKVDSLGNKRASTQSRRRSGAQQQPSRSWSRQQSWQPFDFEWGVGDTLHQSLRFDEFFEVFYGRHSFSADSDTEGNYPEKEQQQLEQLEQQRDGRTTALSTRAAHAHTPTVLLEEPPDGGYGWICTLCVALINAHTWGLNSSYGVFLSFYLSSNVYPGATSLEFAFVGGLSISCAMLVAPLATLLLRRVGIHATLLLGAVVQAGGLVAASFATHIWHLFLTQGAAFGFGMGFLFVGSVGVPSQWFTTRRSLANGLAACGSGFGGLLYSLATGALLRSLGLAWCFRVLGILALGVNALCIAFLRDRSKAIGSRYSPFAVALFRRPEYLLLNGYGFFSMLGYIALVFSLADYGRRLGLDASRASLVSALLNLGQGLGRPPVGYFSDSVGRINMAAATALSCALLIFFVWTAARSFAYLVFYALVGGTVTGSFWATISPVAVEVVGLQDLPAALNLEWLVLVLPCTFSEPIALEILQLTGNYLGTQIFVGCAFTAAGLCALVLRGWKIGELVEAERILAEEQDKDGPPLSPASAGGGTPQEAARAAGRRVMWKNFSKWRKV